ncbi:MAG: zeta toxin family protein [Desulfatibacillum sp.]|nr:zeta toxin family protein [Desulfatibacillum sp.]
MILDRQEKKIIIIAGPNGAGKTTFAEEFLPKEAGCSFFVNADLIAAGLAPFVPESMAIKAGRLMLQEIHEYVRKGQNFAFETTLAGKGYARLIPAWRKSGYLAQIVFLRLSSPELALLRVRQRVRVGGHNVPEQTVRRRFKAGLTNFETIYKPLADKWALYDNSGPSPVLVEEGKLK